MSEEKVNGHKVETVEPVVATPEFLKIFGPILVLRDDIKKATNLDPSGIILPVSLSDGQAVRAVVFGLPVLWGTEDQAPSLVYTPKPLRG